MSTYAKSRVPWLLTSSHPLNPATNLGVHSRSEVLWREALRCRGIECDDDFTAHGWRSAYERLARLRAVGSRCRFSTFSDLEAATFALETSHQLASILDTPHREGGAFNSRCVLIGAGEWSPVEDDEGLEGGPWMASNPAFFEFDGGPWCATMETRVSRDRGGGELGGWIGRQGGEIGGEGLDDGEDCSFRVEIKRTVEGDQEGDDGDSGWRLGGTKREGAEARDWYHVLRARAFSLSPSEQHDVQVGAPVDGSGTLKQRRWSVVDIDGGFEFSSVEIGWCPHRVLKSLPVRTPQPPPTHRLPQQLPSGLLFDSYSPHLSPGDWYFN